MKLEGNKNHFGLENNLHTATFAPRSRAAVARWAHNPKVGSSNLPFATKSRQMAGLIFRNSCTSTGKD
jgi:hypothetical protein